MCVGVHGGLGGSRLRVLMIIIIIIMVEEVSAVLVRHLTKVGLIIETLIILGRRLLRRVSLVYVRWLLLFLLCCEIVLTLHLDHFGRQSCLLCDTLRRNGTLLLRTQGLEKGWSARFGLIMIWGTTVHLRGRSGHCVIRIHFDLRLYKIFFND